MRVRRRGSSGERGAVIVEAAIVFPVLMLLTFGIIEYGLALMTASSTNASSRSGARAGVAVSSDATYYLQAKAAVESDLRSLSSADPLELWIYKVDPADDDGAPLDASCNTSCYRYQWDASTQSFSIDNTSDPWTGAEQDACGAQVDSLGVQVRTRHHFMTNFFGNGKTITEHTVMRLEPQPFESCA